MMSDDSPQNGCASIYTLKNGLYLLGKNLPSPRIIKQWLIRLRDDYNDDWQLEQW